VSRLDVADEVVRDDIEDHIRLPDKRIEELRQAIREHIDDDPGLRSQKELLLSIPGIGEKTVASILSYFATIEKFSSANAIWLRNRLRIKTVSVPELPCPRIAQPSMV
jgi:ERCC4-type nuclease